MKIKDIPQDESALKDFTNELCYAKNENGNYTTAKSKGWNVKKEALDATWNDIENQKKEALEAIKLGIESPINYYMIKSLMDLQILSDYTGFWKITIKRHFKPSVFDKLSKARLEKYASVFKVSIEKLKKPE